MIRLSKLSDYGIVILTHFALCPPERVRTVAEVAQSTRIPEPTVSKVLKMLTRETLLVSLRGVNGGYRLARRPSEISVADIVRALEGPIALMECNEETGQCRQEEICPVRSHWQIINFAVTQTLKGLTLEDMTLPLRPDRFRSTGPFRGERGERGERLEDGPSPAGSVSAKLS